MGEIIRTFQVGRCVATIFENAVTLEGRTVRLPSVVLQRRYHDREGTEKTATSLRLNDLPRAIVVLAHAYLYLVTRAAEDAPEA